jgi:hypothetical protein
MSNVNSSNSKSLNSDQIRQSVQFLSHKFKEACDAYRHRTNDTKNVKGTVLYAAQNDFSYIINEIERGPVFFATQQIAIANDLISMLNSVEKRP